MKDIADGMSEKSAHSPRDSNHVCVYGVKIDDRSIGGLHRSQWVFQLEPVDAVHLEAEPTDLMIAQTLLSHSGMMFVNEYFSIPGVLEIHFFRCL